MQLDDDQFIYRIGKLALGPNDVVLLKTEMALTRDQVQYLADRMRLQLQRAGFNNEVVFMTCGIDLKIIEKEDA
jgi:hypothetical protein